MTRTVRVELAEAQDPGDLAQCVEWLEEEAVGLASDSGLPQEEAQCLGVALREAVFNALRHGQHSDGRPHVVVRLRRAFGVLLMWVRDRGPGFDPSSVEDPRLPQNLPRGNGRGIFYMKRFVDRVSFTFPRDGGVAVGLGKRLPGSSGPRTDAPESTTLGFECPSTISSRSGSSSSRGKGASARASWARRSPSQR